MDYVLMLLMANLLGFAAIEWVSFREKTFLGIWSGILNWIMLFYIELPIIAAWFVNRSYVGTMRKAAILGLAGHFSYMLGLLIGRAVKTPHLMTLPVSEESLKRGAVISILLGILILYFSTRGVGGITGFLSMSYYEKHNAFYGKGYALIFRRLFQLGAAYAIVIVLKNKKLTGLALTMILFNVWFFLVYGKRSPIAVLIVIAMMLYNYYRRKSVQVRYLILFIALVPLFLAMSPARGFLTGGQFVAAVKYVTTEFTVEWLDLSEGDFGGALKNIDSTVSAVDRGAWELRLGDTYLIQPLVALVPRRLLPEKTEIQRMGMQNLNNQEFPGSVGVYDIGTRGYNMFAEAYANFDVIGVLFIPLLFGIGIRFFDKLLWTSGERLMLIFVPVLAQSYRLMRGDFAEVVSATAMTFLASFTVMVLAIFMGKIRLSPYLVGQAVSRHNKIRRSGDRRFLGGKIPFRGKLEKEQI